jgi:hypothetical protein
LFTVVFSLLVSLSIGNLGTGFRLRSSLLWSFHMAMTAILRKL